MTVTGAARWRPWRWPAWLPLLVLAPLISGCSPWPWGPAKVRLGITDWPGYEYFYLAQEWELAEGIELQVNQHSSLKDQRFSYEQGDVDAITTTLTEALAICQEMPPRCPQLVLVLDESVGGDQLIAQRRVSDLAALRGETVGLERSVLGEYLLLRALETVDLRLGDVKLVYDGPRALIDQFRDRSLAAVVTYPPYSDSLVNADAHHLLFSSSQLPGEVVDVLAVSPAFARHHPQRVEALVATWWAARDQARRRPDQAVALMARREGVSVQAFRHSEALLRYVEPRLQWDWLRPGGRLETRLKAMARRLQMAGRLLPTMPLPRVNPRWAQVTPGP